jgi:branched-chain amino acid transport system substrate-binding protein
MRRTTGVLLVAGLLIVTGITMPGRDANAIRLGALYPLTGPASPGGLEELHGLQLAAELTNAAGGVHGRPIDLVVRDSPSPEAAVGAAQNLTRGDHVPLVLGANSSVIALRAEQTVLADGAIYWETGAVASSLLSSGSPHFFRTGVDGSALGAGSAQFTAEILAPLLHLASIRVAVLYVDDIYGQSVAAGALREAQAQGLDVISSIPYSPNAPNYSAMVAAVKRAAPDVLFVASYLSDGVAFRRAALAAHLKVSAMIGTSSAFCMAAFGDLLGADAVGLYASDKPGAAINTRALSPEAASLFATVRRDYYMKYAVQPSPTALAGFVSGWVLFHNVLPRVADVDVDSVAAAARLIDLPDGSEINGAGVRFAASGQNLRPASIIWEWQGVRDIEPVYPPTYALRQPVLLPIDQ